MIFSDLLAAARRDGDTLSFQTPESWKQGRTLYGGLTAGLCLHTAREITGESRQLRSALIAFAGPSADAVTGSARLLRSGRTAATVRASLQNGGDAATEALFTFSDLRESAVSHEPEPMPPVDAPLADRVVNFADFGGPAFGQNFDVIMLSGIPLSGAAQPEITWWARHRDPLARTTDTGLLCLGDILPPAALTMVEQPTPISSMTWMVDMVVEAPQTDDGWYLFRSQADAVSGGFSTQDMSIWNTDGQLIAKGRQTITMFG